jgi:hypothetical protein
MMSQRFDAVALAAALFALIATPTGAASGSLPDGRRLAQAETPAAGGVAPESPKPESPGGMSDEMMGGGMMGGGMMGMARQGMMSHAKGAFAGRAMGMMPMSGAAHMKILFAIVDINEDGALSFDEIMAVHKRVFDMIDTNKDGKVTMEELEAFAHQ